VLELSGEKVYLVQPWLLGNAYRSADSADVTEYIEKKVGIPRLTDPPVPESSPVAETVEKVTPEEIKAQE